ncbi:MAG: DNA polymerase III subunit alpha [Bacilli bacterium]|nr:DNA polymerase III subunit alpha [Bacilli bacterium]
MLIPLKIVTEYTLLKSTIKINKLVKFLIEHNITSCAICDNNLYGVMSFYQEMTKNNLKPIIGLEVSVENNPLYLYAKNSNGYHNLLKIHTLKEKESLNFENLISILNDIKIVLPRESYVLLDRFPNAYLSYKNDTEKIEALMNSEKSIYINPAHSLTKENTEDLKYLEAIEKGILLKEVNTDYSNMYLKTNITKEDEETTESFISDIDIVLENTSKYIPKFDKDIDSFKHLYTLTNKGLKKRLNNNVSEVYQKRLNYELSVIKNMGFDDYFLIVYDYVLYAKKNNILVGPGRGSAAGSLVSFCLGITDIDPIKYDLLFERFLNPERITMPDIDIDFEYTKRGEVIEYVRKRYGENNVAPIMTFGTLGAKQVIRDVGRVLDMPLDLIDKFVKSLAAKLSLKENLEIKPVNDFLKNYKELQKLYDIAYHLEGLKRHVSTHAAGVVISSIPLDEVIPIYYNGEFIMTGLTMEYLEDLGLLKMDFLALRNLTIISNVLELIKSSTGKVLDLNRLNLNDKSILELFSKGDTEGIFQYESSGMRNLMLKLKPTSFSDLVASVALFRPGSMNQIDSFIARKYGKEKITYLHKDLEPILKETYGIIIYQEQVMQILVKIGGYSYAEADIIRRAMSKKKQDIILNDRDHFIKEATKRGYEENIAKGIYDLIIPFAGYGFNKSHSVSYALIGYQMAYLKAKFPMYFITNLLNMSMGSIIKTKEYIDEARKKDIIILKPNINISTNEYLIKDNSLLLPLSSIKNLGINASTEILKERDNNGNFKDYIDFVTRVYGKSVNKKTIISLIDAGVLDSFNVTKKTMIENLDIVVNYADLVGSLDAAFCIPPALEIKEEYSEEELRLKEHDSYGFYVTNHPVSKYNDKSIVKLKEVENFFDKHIKCVVLVERIKTVKTKKGDNMAFITASDETDSKDFVVFPLAFYMISNLKVGDIITLQGKVTKRFSEYQINIDFLNKIKEDNN